MSAAGWNWYRRWLARHRENSFVVLLAGTVLLLLLFPFLHGDFWLRLIRGMLILALYLPTVFAHGRHLGLLTLASCLFLTSLGTLVWELSTGAEQAELWHSAANACYFLVLACVLIRFVAGQELVSHNVVFATLVVYVLLAFTWTFLYDFVETLDRGSFAHMGTGEGDMNQRVAFFYFSMTTITTVGYGDITPVTPLARMLAIVEALVGQMYLVAAVATVVGLRATMLADSRRSRKGAD